MASWLDDILTNAGNALVATQSPFGTLSPQADPQARQALINNALLTIGAGMMSGARQGQGPLEAFGNSWMGLNQQGAQRSQQQLQNMLLMGKMGEMQKKNQTRETLKKMTPPEGYTPETWGAFVDAADAKDLLGIYQQSIQRQRDRAAIGSMGGFPGMGGPSAAPMPGGAPVQPTGDPVLDAIARSESGGRMVTNPTSGATGTFQFMPATWRDLVKNNPNAGLTPEGINDPQQQAVAAKLFRGQINEAFGGTATPGQTYLGWFLGPQGARSISMMPTSTPIDDALTRIFGADMAKKVKSQNQAVFNGVRTSGDLLSFFDQKMAGTGGQQPTQESVTPVQYTPGQPQGQPAPQIDYDSDPVIRQAREAQRVAAKRGEIKEFLAAKQKEAERIATLQGRSFDLEKSRVQGADRARIMQDTEVLKVDVNDAAKIWEGLQNNALKSRTGLANVKQLERLSDGLATGRLAPTTQEIKRVAKSLGIDLETLGIKDNVAQGEAIAALANQMALQFRDTSSGAGMPGAMSDADRQFLMEMVPGLSTTPEGRKLMIGYLKRIHEYNIGMAKAVQKYRESADWRKNPVGLARVAHEYADANQIAFNEEDMQTILRLGRPQAQPIPTSPPPDPEASGRIKQKYGLD